MNITSHARHGIREWMRFSVYLFFISWRSPFVAWNESERERDVFAYNVSDFTTRVTGTSRRRLWRHVQDVIYSIFRHISKLFISSRSWYLWSGEIDSWCRRSNLIIQFHEIFGTKSISAWNDELRGKWRKASAAHFRVHRFRCRT